MPSITTPLERVANIIDPNSTSTVREKINALSSFSQSLHDVTLDQAQSVFATVSLANFYMLFGVVEGSDDEEELNRVLCEVIRKLLDPFTYDMIAGDENNMMFLIQGLNHFSPDIRYLSLLQVERCLNSTDQTIDQVARSNVFTFVLATIAFQQTQTANKAVDIAAKISCKAPDVLFTQNAAILRNLLGTNETVRFRVYELIVRVAGSSSRAFEIGEASGMFNGIINEVQSTDTLVALNAIEILRQIADTPAGLAFLEKSNLLGHLSSSLDIGDDNDTAVILTKSATILFFSQLAHNQEIQFEPIERKYKYLDKLQRRLDDDDTNKEILTAVIGSIGLVGSTAQGLGLLQNTSSLLNKFMGLFQTTAGDLKVEFLHSLSKLISVRGDPAAEHMTRQVYEAMDGRPTTLDNLVQTAKQPVDDIRVAAFTCINSIASHIWGRQEMVRNEHILGYLVDRTAEHTVEGQRWKFTICETLISADDAQQTLGDHYHILRNYVRQGLYYRPTEPAAALESA
ncbi:26S proteasome non-ATPase regulatory subunit 5 [Zychaea mexicana]|uniref:26S proteasome non-ATPase regulatory subunit 5 n=1 Tax=Zychaea mexicana TaxID=64656 RepID=UPI0022FF0B9A|nr:26S proteasome non-ATPase regulatory subunit 5 [Zychaea mexicana]KAI9499712.1 26S proteasome non-ATPase regulatory subunit 5 [Zychaea mexicana]